MKKLVSGLLLCLINLPLLAQQNFNEHEISGGYTINNLGESYHLVYGLGDRSKLIYLGLRVQENSPLNIMEPIDGIIYRAGKDGRYTGLNLGFQRRFNLAESSIVPFAGIDLDMAYLESHEWITNLSTMETYRYHEAAAMKYVSSLIIGFEARVYRNFFLKQHIGASALFDTRYQGGLFDKYNGMGFNLRFALGYKF